MEPPSSFATLLRRSRKAANLTQEELAERAGVSSRTISDLERAIVRAPREDTLHLLADALHLTGPERQEWERLRRQLSRRSSTSRAATGLRTRGHSAFWNVPVALNALIGREEEIATITETLRRPEVRLMTLTGVGGVGKTRLAMAVAEAVRHDYPGGVAFVDLAALNDPGQLLAAIISTLGIREVAGQSLRETIVAYPADRPVLLVLDNFEQIVDAAADVSDLLRASPHLTVLVTSRIPLRVRGEHVLVVQPLLMTPAKRTSTADGVVPRGDASVLFVQCARAVDPGFRLTDDNAIAILEICRRLDGLPLAIELAAARIVVLPPQRLLDHLECRLPLLTDGPRDAPERQRTLRDTIAWSYGLLSPEQQALFCDLSVCSGGWSLEVAGAVVGREARSSGGLELLNDMQALVDHNLVRQSTGNDGDARFTMLETIREFGHDQLCERGDAEYVCGRHADFFMQFAERCDALIEGPEQVLALQWYDREHDNLLAALAWLRDRADAERAMYLAGMLGRFWFCRGLYSMGRAEIASILALPGAGRRTKARGHALRAAAWLHTWQGEHLGAVSMSSEAISIWEDVGDRDDLADAYIILGIAHGFGGDSDRAVQAWTRAMAIAEEVGDSVNLARALTNLGFLAQTQGDNERAILLCREALTAARVSGNPATIELVGGNLASLLQDRGEHVEAEELFRESLALHQRLEIAWSMASELESLAHYVFQRGRPAHAAQLIGAAAAIRETIGVPVQPVNRAAYDSLVIALEVALGDEFEVAWTSGSELTFDEAVALGLADRDTGETAGS